MGRDRGGAVSGLDRGEVHLWLCRTDALDPDLARGLSRRWLSFAERDRAARFVAPQAGDRYRAAHLLLRRVLARYTGQAEPAIRFARDYAGKPRLAAGADSISFSLSHSRDFVAVAVAEGCEVGVDVEGMEALTDPAPDGLHGLGSAFDEEDRAALLALPPLRRRSELIRIWTLKEAVAKATGRGLSLPLRAAKFPLRGARPDPCAVAGSAQLWGLTCVAAGKTAWLAVAVAASSGRTKLIRTTTFPLGCLEPWIERGDTEAWTHTGLPGTGPGLPPTQQTSRTEPHVRA